jgi:hypothetical protein
MQSSMDRPVVFSKEFVQVMDKGELVLTVRATEYRGQVRPYVVRCVSRADSVEKQESEQHIVLKDAADLQQWVKSDELSSLYPEFFERVRLCCEGLLQ